VKLELIVEYGGERTALLDVVGTRRRIFLVIGTSRARCLSVFVVVRACLTRDALVAVGVSSRRTQNYNHMNTRA